MPAEKKRRPGEYEPAPPLHLGADSFATPEKPPIEALRAPLVAELAPRPVQPKAVWIVHGMGQQIPFETLDQLTEGLLGAIRRAWPHISKPKPQARVVRIGEDVLRRVELDFTDDHATQHQWHLYEAYWAPKTEGAVDLSDVIGFLWRGATRGLVNSIGEFQRAMFGKMESFSLSFRTPTYTFVSLLILASLVVINATILAVAAARADFANAQSFIPANMYEPLTAVASIVCGVAITFGLVLLLGEMGRPTAKGAWRTTLRRSCWTGFILTIVTLLVVAALMGLMTRKAPTPVWPTPACQQDLRALSTILVLVSLALALLSLWIRRKIRARGGAPEESAFLGLMFYLGFLMHVAAVTGVVFLVTAHACNPARPAWALPACLRWLSSPFWVWPFLIAISAKVRTLLVQYVGDVAAYVDSNRVDKFEQLREDIKDTARKSASAVYLAQADGRTEFEYGHVAVVGHSLGSVIAYDTLNRLINDDGLSGKKIGVVDRTRVLLTFGSPLDKIAFFFAIQAKKTGRIRESLAAAVQPLIQDYANRTFDWINVYTRNDIISGSLDFYDEKGKPKPPGVINEPDEDAFIPLVAHVDYWKTTKVWDKLLEKLR